MFRKTLTSPAMSLKAAALVETFDALNAEMTRLADVKFVEADDLVWGGGVG
jgi:hypothetical protein